MNPSNLLAQYIAPRLETRPLPYGSAGTQTPQPHYQGSWKWAAQLTGQALRKA